MTRRFSTPRAILHAAGVAVMAYGYLGLRNLPFDALINAQYGGHFRYLTNQGLVVAWLTMLLGLLMDLIPYTSGLLRIQRVLLMISLPLEAIITAIYWSLLLFYPHLILSKEFAEAALELPLHIDLALHAAPVVVLLLEFLLFGRRYSKRAVSTGAPVLVAVCGLWYGWWAEQCAVRNHGTFPYPFLTGNPFEVRLVIYFGVSMLALSSFWMINALHP